jgi:hypothetical protein
VLPDGTIFITGHLLAQDVRNKWGYTCGFLHRSTDRGQTWQSLRFESEGIKPGASNHSTRNVLRLADGTLLLGVDYDGGGGPYLIWRSTDNGATWDKTQRCQPKDFQSKYGFFGGETWLWQAKSGKLWALVRVDSNELPIRDRPIKAGNDQADHFILFSSSDGAKTFDRIRDFGDYGEMYMSLLRLQDRRLLLTFTVRDLKPPLGVRAIPGTRPEIRRTARCRACAAETRFSMDGFGLQEVVKTGFAGNNETVEAYVNEVASRMLRHRQLADGARAAMTTCDRRSACARSNWPRSTDIATSSSLSAKEAARGLWSTW